MYSGRIDSGSDERRGVVTVTAVAPVAGASADAECDQVFRLQSNYSLLAGESEFRHDRYLLVRLLDDLSRL